MTIHSGMIVSNYWQVLGGDIATSTTVNAGGYMRVSSGGGATSTTVNSGGYIGVYGGGFAVSTTVNNDGEMWVSSGGTATSTTVNSNGEMWVSSGGSATWCRGFRCRRNRRHPARRSRQQSGRMESKGRSDGRNHHFGLKI